MTTTQTLANRPAAELTGRQRRAEAVALAFLASYSGRTQAAYAADLRDYWTFCEANRLDVLAATRAHVTLYARALEEAGRARSTVARKLSTVAGLYRYALEEGVIDCSPVAHVRRPRVPDESPTLGLDRAEALALLTAAEVAGARDHALLCLLTLNGLRVSEACNAQVTELSTERGHRVLTVTRKGGRRAQVALAPRTAAALETHLDGRTSGPLLLANDGGNLDRYDATRIVRRLARAAGISKRISPHSLRHSFVTLALDAGVSLRDVQDAAGHADPRTTRRYDRARQSLDRSATYSVASYLAAAS
jgi:site-specific recombinase XerD